MVPVVVPGLVIVLIAEVVVSTEYRPVGERVIGLNPTRIGNNSLFVAVVVVGMVIDRTDGSVHGDGQGPEPAKLVLVKPRIVDNHTIVQRRGTGCRRGDRGRGAGLGPRVVVVTRGTAGVGVSDNPRAIRVQRKRPQRSAVGRIRTIHPAVFEIRRCVVGVVIPKIV